MGERYSPASSEVEALHVEAATINDEVDVRKIHAGPHTSYTELAAIAMENRRQFDEEIFVDRKRCEKLTTEYRYDVFAGEVPVYFDPDLNEEEMAGFDAVKDYFNSELYRQDIAKLGQILPEGFELRPYTLFIHREANFKALGGSGMAVPTDDENLRNISIFLPITENSPEAVRTIAMHELTHSCDNRALYRRNLNEAFAVMLDSEICGNSLNQRCSDLMQDVILEEQAQGTFQGEGAFSRWVNRVTHIKNFVDFETAQEFQPEINKSEITRALWVYGFPAMLLKWFRDTRDPDLSCFNRNDNYIKILYAVQSLSEEREETDTVDDDQKSRMGNETLFRRMLSPLVVMAYPDGSSRVAELAKQLRWANRDEIRPLIEQFLADVDQVAARMQEEFRLYWSKIFLEELDAEDQE